MDTEDRKILARTSLFLFIAGITIPFLVAAWIGEELAMAFGLVTEILALVFGIISWKHLFGKISSIGVGILMILAIIQFVYFLKRKAEIESEMNDVFQTLQNLN